MTVGSGAWADRVDALLRDRRELFEAQAEENILLVILLRERATLLMCMTSVRKIMCYILILFQLR